MYIAGLSTDSADDESGAFGLYRQREQTADDQIESGLLNAGIERTLVDMGTVLVILAAPLGAMWLTARIIMRPQPVHEV